MQFPTSALLKQAAQLRLIHSSYILVKIDFGMVTVVKFWRVGRSFESSIGAWQKAGEMLTRKFGQTRSIPPKIKRWLQPLLKPQRENVDSCIVIFNYAMGQCRYPSNSEWEFILGCPMTKTYRV